MATKKKVKPEKLTEVIMLIKEDHLRFKEEQLNKFNEIQLKLQTNDLQHSQITVHLTEISKKLDNLNNIKLNGDDVTVTLEEALHSIFAATKTLRVRKRFSDSAKEYIEASTFLTLLFETKIGKSVCAAVLFLIVTALLDWFGVIHTDPIGLISNVVKWILGSK